jgi:hypothetical protein
MANNEVPIPFNLSQNPRDRRGLPIPFIVYKDMNGVPHFTVDDVSALNLVLADKLCGLCGKPLKMGQMWQIGGPISAFHEDGLYIEPPAHEECARYAIQVCPFIAATNYARRIEAKTLKSAAVHDEAMVHDNGMAPPRPLFFALTRTSGIKLFDANDGSGQHHIQPRRPWKHVEFWKNGEQITQEEAEAIAEDSDNPPSTLKWWPV